MYILAAVTVWSPVTRYKWGRTQISSESSCLGSQLVTTNWTSAPSKMRKLAKLVPREDRSRNTPNCYNCHAVFWPWKQNWQHSSCRCSDQDQCCCTSLIITLHKNKTFLCKVYPQQQLGIAKKIWDAARQHNCYCNGRCIVCHIWRCAEMMRVQHPTIS